MPQKNTFFKDRKLSNIFFLSKLENILFIALLRNCCEDFRAHCPGEHRLGEASFPRHMTSRIECVDNYLTIASCPRLDRNISADEDTEDLTVTPKCIDLLNKGFKESFDGAPVSEISTGLVYKNMSIFKCFSGNTQDAAEWSIALALARPVNYFRSFRDVVLQTQETPHNMGPRYSPPYAGISSFLTYSLCFPETNASCILDMNTRSWRDYQSGSVQDERKMLMTQSNESDIDFKKKCASSHSSYVFSDRKIYKNIYCLVANSQSNEFYRFSKTNLFDFWKQIICAWRSSCSYIYRRFVTQKHLKTT